MHKNHKFANINPLHRNSRIFCHRQKIYTNHNKSIKNKLSFIFSCLPINILLHENYSTPNIPIPSPHTPAGVSAVQTPPKTLRDAGDRSGLSLYCEDGSAFSLQGFALEFKFEPALLAFRQLRFRFLQFVCIALECRLIAGIQIGIEQFFP